MLGRRSGDFSQQLVLEKFPGNYGQVIGRGIMVVVMEAVGIGKMGVQAAKFRCFLVHHFREPFRTSPDMFRHCVGNFIGGANEDTIKAFFHSDRLPHIHSHIGTAFFNRKNCVAGKRDNFIQGRIFGGNQASKNFGSACRIKFFVDIFAVKDNPGIGFYYNGGFRAYQWPVRPVFDFIGLYRKRFPVFHSFHQVFIAGSVGRHSIPKEH